MSAKKTTKPTKSSLNRREAMRAQRIAEARRQQRNRVLIVVAIVVVVAVVITLVVTLINQNPKPAKTSTPAANQQIDPPDGDSQRAWITVPSPATKPDALTFDIHFDYQCPICKIAEDNYKDLLEQLNTQGDIVLRQHTRTFLDQGLKNDASVRAAVAAACVDVADSSKYAAYHNTVFNNQPTTEGDGYTDGQLRNDFATAAGLTGDALTTFQQCYDNQATLQWVNDVEQNNIAALPNTAGSPKYLFGGNQPKVDTNGQCTGTTGAQVGVCGTPDFFVNGIELTLSDLIVQNADKSYAAKYPTADALLTFLKQTAAS